MKHLSLDFWNTLGRPNPEYAKARNQILSGLYGVSPEKAGEIYADAKATVDRTHCATARPLSLEMCYQLLDDRMAEHIGSGGYHAQQLLENAFALYPPTLVPEAVAGLQAIREAGQGNITISITSNTNFIRGEMIRKVVLDPVFDFDWYLFSDEAGYAKPHPEIWRLLHERAGVPKRDVLHIGDSSVCDADGARKAGMRGVLVSGPDQTAMFLGAIAVNPEVW